MTLLECLVNQGIVAEPTMSCGCQTPGPVAAVPYHTVPTMNANACSKGKQNKLLHGRATINEPHLWEEFVSSRPRHQESGRAVCRDS